MIFEVLWRRSLRAALAVAWGAMAALTAHAAEMIVEPLDVADWKTVYGTVESRDVAAARSRIGGTLVALSVTEGDRVEAGATIARVVDDKLALQMRAVDARLRALAAEQANAKAELDRATALVARGAATQQRVDQLRTQVDVLANQITAAEAERAVIVQQQAEGDVAAPASGRVLRVSVTRGTVVMPGETIATVSGGGIFLRLALPERHARQLRHGAAVVLERDEGGARGAGRIAKLYPQMEGGRVIADVEVQGLGDYFVGERVLVRVPIGDRQVIALPRSAIATRAGLDFVRVATPDGARDVLVLIGPPVETAHGTWVEVLSGLHRGDKVVMP